jgi:AcrR family transcriptional regulator
MQGLQSKFFSDRDRQVTTEESTRTRILQSALRLFATQGFEGTTTKDLAQAANVAEGTLFRYFTNKKAILVELATEGWIGILTDLLTELSEMGSYKAIAQVIIIEEIANKRVAGTRSKSREETERL